MGKHQLDKTSVNSAVSKTKGESSQEGPILYNSPQSPQSPGRTKAVSFGEMRIRKYSIILGDHPFCVSGCPLQLGWDHEGEERVTIDDFETSRQPRRTLAEMRTTWHQRREMLSEFTDRDIRLNCRKLQRSRRVQGDLSNFFSSS